MTTCTGCPALTRAAVTPMGICPLGVRTGTTKQDGRRIRVPLEECQRPRTDADVVDRLEIMADEEKQDDTD